MTTNHKYIGFALKLMTTRASTYLKQKFAETYLQEVGPHIQEIELFIYENKCALLEAGLILYNQKYKNETHLNKSKFFAALLEISLGNN